MGVGPVGELGPLRLVQRRGRPDRGEERLHPGGHQPPLDPPREVGGDQVGELAQGRVLGGAGRGVDDHDLPAQLWSGPPDPLFRAQRVRAAAADAGSQPGQGLQGGRTAGAVRGDADVALELTYGALGDGPEATVHPADLEAEVEEPALQGQDVVAGEQAPWKVHQHPVAEGPPGLVEGAEGGQVDHPVGGETALLLEGPHRALDLDVVVAVGRAGGAVGQETGLHQTVADLGDGVALVAEPEDGPGGALDHRFSSVGAGTGCTGWRARSESTGCVHAAPRRAWLQPRRALGDRRIRRGLRGRRGPGGPGGPCCSADEVGQLLEDRRLRPGAHDLLDDLAVVVEVHRRNAGDAVLRRARPGSRRRSS